jgi:SAM-dependent methyltransferase
MIYPKRFPHTSNLKNGRVEVSQVDRPSLHDHLSLLACRASKWRKGRLSDGSQKFYETFFREEHLEQYRKDIRNVLKLREVQKALSSLPSGAVVIDVGSGVGHVLRNLPVGLRKLGMDFSLESCRLSVMGGTDRGSVVNGSIYEIPVQDASVDAAVCLEVLEHLEDDKRALCEIGRILKPGGKLLLSLPGTYYFPEYKELIGHLRHYTREEAVSMLKDSGFNVLYDIEKYEEIQNIYFYVFVFLETVKRVLNLFVRRKTSIYQLRIIGMREPIYDAWVVPWAKKYAERLKGKDPSETHGRGVFLVAVKEGKI